MSPSYHKKVSLFSKGGEKRNSHAYGALLWEPTREDNENTQQQTKKGTEANSVYNLPSVEALVRYMYAESGFPVKSTWIKAIKNGNFDSWTVLTYNNSAKYWPHSVETLKIHMVKSSQGVRSTNKNKYQKQNNQNKPSQGTI